MTPQTDTMEINGLAEIASGIVGVVGGVFGGIRLGKSRQLEEIKEMIEVYKEAHNFTKEEAAELRIGIKASRDHNEKCEKELLTVKNELAEFKGFVKAKLTLE